MNKATMRIALRSTAVLIAVVALIDPVWSSSRLESRSLVAIRLASTDVQATVASLGARLAGWDVVSREVVGSRIPCGPEEHCVVIADGSRDAEIPGDVKHPVSLVTVRRSVAPNVSMRSAVAGAGHNAAAGGVRVELRREGAVTQTRVEVRDGAALVGSALHEWKSDSAVVDVPWWPIESGSRTLRIEALPVDGETSAIDNTIDVGVMITAARARVLVFDARPSWSSTFVRRALEDDARFAVDYRTRLAPALSAGTVNGRLDARVLDSAAVVVVGGPDALTVDDVRLLEQFVRIRGGTLVLLPERREMGEAARLFGGNWTEHLTPSPERVGPLQASEILRAGGVSIAANILGRSASSPSIVVAPTGNGRIVVSGAMDAWRYRDLDAGAFDQFWRSLVAEGAVAGEGLQLRFARPLAADGSRARFTLRDHRMRAPVTVEASAVWRCGSGAAHVVRLWPSGILGEFAGEVPIQGTGSCSVEATVGDRQVTATAAVADGPMRGVDSTLASLAGRVATINGSIASADDVSPVTRAIASSPAAMSPVVTMHPMRWWWWMMPFAGCLSLEWWLRRRGGLR